jgi:hypothetical protein
MTILDLALDAKNVDLVREMAGTITCDYDRDDYYPVFVGSAESILQDLRDAYPDATNAEIIHAVSLARSDLWDDRSVHEQHIETLNEIFEALDEMVDLLED